ncbi:TerC family protein [Candidatus Berkiella aquae]|uniref:Inner membrane protein alx n=2 Tax=Candidatus Berkiella aquae TaxID=295108 RepID=A0A0Q9YY40_9GAMM|nr:TerC family protein [Candidatus Berkiella aquae]
MVTVGQWWMWIIFFTIIGLMLFADIFLLGGGKSHRVSTKEASIWIIVWVSIALCFNVGLWFYLLETANQQIANTKAAEFLTGYLIELSLSVDNLFVFILIFNYFKLPLELQRRTLLFGIIGAIVMRLIFITLGVWLVAKFHWILYLFGGFLVYTGIKILVTRDEEPHLENNPVLLWSRKHLRITEHLEGERFFVRKEGLLYVTPLFIILMLIELSDVIFAIDSIPAIFAITTDPFIIYTSNIFAILGLRAMYFLLARLAELFHYLKYGVALILIFIGVKMLIAYWFKVPIYITLSLIVITLGTCIIISRVHKPQPK